MGIAKGKLYVSKEELKNLFGLPEDVEIIAVKPREFDEAFEFMLASSNEVEGITKKDVPIGLQRRISIGTLNKIKYAKEDSASSSVNTNTVDILATLPNEFIISKEDAKKLFEPIKARDNINNITINVDKIINDEKDIKKIFDDVMNNLKKMNK